MKVKYGIVKEVYTQNQNTRVSYGIAAYIESSENGTACIINSVRDVTSDFTSLQRLADLCNRLELSPNHLQDAVEDYMIGNTDLNI